jgi:type III secretion protein K
MTQWPGWAVKLWLVPFEEIHPDWWRPQWPGSVDVTPARHARASLRGWVLTQQGLASDGTPGEALDHPALQIAAAGCARLNRLAPVLGAALQACRLRTVVRGAELRQVQAAWGEPLYAQARRAALRCPQAIDLDHDLAPEDVGNPGRRGADLLRWIFGDLVAAWRQRCLLRLPAPAAASAVAAPAALLALARWVEHDVLTLVEP